PLCNPTKLDAASTRYAKGVDRALAASRIPARDVAKLPKRVTGPASRKQYLRIYLHLQRAIVAILRALDAPRPGASRFAAWSGGLRRGSLLEARGPQNMRHAVAAGRAGEWDGGRDLVLSRTVHYATASTGLKRITSAPPCA